MNCLWRLVIIIEWRGRLLLVRRPLGATWAPLSDNEPVSARVLKGRIRGRVFRPDISFCSPVPGQFGFLSGMLYENQFPFRLDQREQDMRDLIRPFVGSFIADHARLGGFCELPWGDQRDPFPVHVQVMRLEPAMHFEPVGEHVEDARHATLRRIVAPDVHEALEAVSEDVDAGKPDGFCDVDVRAAPPRIVDTVSRPALKAALAEPSRAMEKAERAWFEAKQELDKAKTELDKAKRDTEKAIRVLEQSEKNKRAGEPPDGHGAAGAAASASAATSGDGGEDTAGPEPRATDSPGAREPEDAGSKPMFQDFWGGDQAETGLFWDFTRSGERDDIEDAATLVLQRLPSHAWTILDEFPDLRYFKRSRTLDFDHCGVILKWAECALGEVLLDLLRKKHLNVRKPTTPFRGGKRFVTPEATTRAVKNAFLRGSFLEVVVVAMRKLSESPQRGVSAAVTRALTADEEAVEKGFGAYVPNPFFRREIERGLHRLASSAEGMASAASRAEATGTDPPPKCGSAGMGAAPDCGSASSGPASDGGWAGAGAESESGSDGDAGDGEQTALLRHRPAARVIKFGRKCE